MRAPLSSTLLVACAAACGQGNPGAVDADLSVDAAPEGQGAPPRHDLVVNEVAAGGPDWIEIANRGDTAHEVGGWFVTDSPDRLDHYYRFPDGTLIAPGDYLIVHADEGAPGAGHHAPFKLGLSDGAYLLDRDGMTVDALLFLSTDDGRSLQRIPDREGLFFAAPPSAGAANP